MAWNGIRNTHTTFLGCEFHEQKCPTCETVYRYLALGKDARRPEMECPQCQEPELFVEKDISPELVGVLKDLDEE